MEEISEYEAMRMSNYTYLKNECEKLFKDEQWPTLSQVPEIEKCKKPRKFNVRANQPFRMSLRSSGKTPDIDCKDSDSFLDDKNMPSRKPLRRSLPITHFVPVPNVKQPSQITQKDIDNICYKNANRVHDAVNGTTCHQCRQKSMDFKSICRNSSCYGIRGQFCGFCLDKRYGEDVAVVVMKEDWSCPPCRNICNCSICRKKNGKRPTGILAPIVINQGYSNVNEFLMIKEQKNENQLDNYKNFEEETEIEELNKNEEQHLETARSIETDDISNWPYSSDDEDFEGF